MNLFEGHADNQVIIDKLRV